MWIITGCSILKGNQMTAIKELSVDILVIGSGAAGLAAAAAAARLGQNVLVADERQTPGGILPQCIHKGFGAGRYGMDMTGPEYLEQEFRKFADSGSGYPTLRTRWKRS